jgi:hypothetical protein
VRLIRISSALLQNILKVTRERAGKRFVATALSRRLSLLTQHASGARHLHTKLSGNTVIFFLL